MPNVLFNNWMLLAGLLALAIPVIIHLLLKRRQQRMRFSTIRFFKEQDEQARRRRRLRNLLLLSLRLLLVALLVLAFARPYLMDAGEQADAASRRNVILVLDGSASMRTGDRWSRAVAKVHETLNELTEDDRIALVVCDVRTEVVSPLVPPSRLTPAIAALRAGLGGARLAEGLVEAATLAASADTGAPVSILLISDLQSHSCERLGEVRLATEVELRIEALGEINVENAGIAELRPVGAASVAIQLRNHSLQNGRAARLQLRVDDLPPTHTFSQLPANSETNLVLSLPRLAPGWHRIAAELVGNDEFAVDDVHELALRVPEPQVVWCLEAQKSERAFEQQTFFVASALAPGGDETPLHLVETFPVGEAITRLGRETPALIIIPGLRAVPPALPHSLSNYVARGGGLLLFVGGEVRPDRYNIEWRGLLPATLHRVEGDPATPETYWQLPAEALDGLLFAAFREPRSGDLARPLFKRRCDLVPGADSRVLAVFGDGKPFVVARETGEGQVVLVNTSAGTEWNDWPKRRTFVPWVHGLAGVTTGQAPWLDHGVGRALIFDASVELTVGTAQAGTGLRWLDPEGAVTPVLANGQGRIRVAPERYGIHEVRTDTDQPLQMVAINPPPEESSTMFLAPAEVQRGIVREADARQQGALASLLGLGQRELWRIILGVGLALLIAESLLANRTWV